MDSKRIWRLIAIIVGAALAAITGYRFIPDAAPPEPLPAGNHVYEDRDRGGDDGE